MWWTTLGIYAWHIDTYSYVLLYQIYYGSILLRDSAHLYILIKCHNTNRNNQENCFKNLGNIIDGQCVYSNFIKPID